MSDALQGSTGYRKHQELARAELARWQAIAATPAGELLNLAAQSVQGTTKAITIHLTDGLQWVQIEDNDRTDSSCLVHRVIVGRSFAGDTLDGALRSIIDDAQGELPRYE